MIKLTSLIKKKKLKVIGLLSGTSADGVDACLAQISGDVDKIRLKQLAFKTYPFAKDIQKKILKLSNPNYRDLDEILRLDMALGKYFARSAIKMVKDFGYHMKNVDLIGSHGQTIRHLPEPFCTLGEKVKSTYQIGDPSVIAATTGVTTVGDFRRSDMASGGEGAPLSPLAHFCLFNMQNTPQGVLNLGGVANLTILPGTNKPDDVWGFDTGPANMVVDFLVRKYFGKKFDENGKIAFSGKIDEKLLTILKKNEYFKRKPPKSTGREIFGEEFMRKIIEHQKKNQIRPEDLVTTASELVVQTIGESFFKFVKLKKKLKRLIITGGGAHNRYFTFGLSQLFRPTKVTTSEVLGFDPDSVEALVFALLAYLTIRGTPGNIKGVTGAKKKVVLGKVCFSG